MTQYIDATTYAFTITLAVVLTGIALGGAVAARLLTGQRDWLAWLSAIQIATGLTVLFGMGLITWSDAPGVDGMRPVQRVSLGLLLPSLLLGVSFPVLLKLGVPTSRRHRRWRPREAGRPLLWRERARRDCRFAGGRIPADADDRHAPVDHRARRRLRRHRPGAERVAPTSRPDDRPGRRRPRCLRHARPDGFPDPFVASTRDRVGPGSSEIFRDEGVQMAVSVHATQFQRTLHVGGLHQANDSIGMVRLHRRIGLLPMALHPAPDTALVIGLGGGATAGAVSQHAGTSVQIVELSDGVRKAAPFFSHVTYDVLNQPNVRVRVDDGRNFLMLSGEQFDVITADIIQPVHAGAGNLYSREYFELVRAVAPPRRAGAAVDRAPREVALHADHAHVPRGVPARHAVARRSADGRQPRAAGAGRSRVPVEALPSRPLAPRWPQSDWMPTRRCAAGTPAGRRR